MILAKAERADGKGETVGCLVYRGNSPKEPEDFYIEEVTPILEKDIDYDPIVEPDYRCHIINPETLQYAFDGEHWFTEDEIVKALKETR